MHWGIQPSQSGLPRSLLDRPFLWPNRLLNATPGSVAAYGSTTLTPRPALQHRPRHGFTGEEVALDRGFVDLRIRNPCVIERDQAFVLDSDRGRIALDRNLEQRAFDFLHV